MNIIASHAADDKQRNNAGKTGATDGAVSSPPPGSGRDGEAEYA
jgi:hypothetical protein